MRKRQRESTTFKTGQPGIVETLRPGGSLSEKGTILEVYKLSLQNSQIHFDHFLYKNSALANINKQQKSQNSENQIKLGDKKHAMRAPLCFSYCNLIC